MVVNVIIGDDKSIRHHGNISKHMKIHYLLSTKLIHHVEYWSRQKLSPISIQNTPILKQQTPL
jgi:hypothetical protein